MPQVELTATSRLVEHFPRGRLVEIGDRYTLLPEDQPAQPAAELRGFVSLDVEQARA